MVVQAHWILTLHDGARTKRRDQNVGKPVDLTRVPWADRRHRQDLAVEQLDVFLRREDAGVSHRVVFVDREEAGMISDCHGTLTHR
jgi:aminoglycoside phosphotransferase family enzyme